MEDKNNTTVNVQPLQVPLLHASLFQTTWNSNEISLLLANMVPALDPADGSMASLAQPIASLSLSPQSAKDLSILLAEAVSQYESKHGEIRTDFTLARTSAGS